MRRKHMHTHNISNLTRAILSNFQKRPWVKNFRIFWKLTKIPFKWYHQSSYLRDKNICQFSRTMDYSPWSEAEKWQIRARTKCWIETHHFKGIFLSFQKIPNFLHWINCTQVMAVERCSTTRPPPPLRLIQIFQLP